MAHSPSPCWVKTSLYFYTPTASLPRCATAAATARPGCQKAGSYAETVIDPANPERFQRISGVKDAITTRQMRNAYFLPFSRRLDIEYTSGIRHVIINCFTPIDNGSMMLCQWLFRNDTEADCLAQMLIDFDAEITLEEKESSNRQTQMSWFTRGGEALSSPWIQTGRAF